ncbi:homeodomain-interacting protein kinase 2-like [Corythoichthys intestinalis]|uniref:homeodomain-interacting protein kinase 2-like n=1 Tax=Corythoichthys intestinalis TaxID=161448 RepID=UPI0025A6868A|nr:homeodomain-interacting protein kinase 2-like [Corythoichthys intestinalis]
MALTVKSGNLHIYKGCKLGQFYKVEDFLGEGSFGIVAKCRCIVTGKMAAIKVLKNHPAIMHQAREEIAVLKQLQRLDPDQANIVRWNDFFFNKQLICLNFELLDQCLNIFQQEQNLPTLSLCEMSPILYQMGTALLHLSDIGIVHTDIKTDNIMVVDRHQRPLHFKLIDFGLAKNVSDLKPGDYVQTSWYRAPEVVLGGPFNEAIDMWSLGIVAVKLATGYHLYPGDSDYDTLAYIIQTQGRPSESVLDRGLRTSVYFKKQDTSPYGWKFKTPKEMGFDYIEVSPLNLKSLEEIEVVQETGKECDQRVFIDLVTNMLHLDPDLRIKPAAFLKHSFFNPSQDENNEDTTQWLGQTTSTTERTELQDKKETEIKMRSTDSCLKILYRKIEGAFTVN